MKYVMRLAMLLSLMSAPAQAYEVETGPVLICDTQEQAERFVQLFDGNRERAINAVNAEQQNPTAYAFINAAYVLGSQLGIARNPSHAFGITGIAVIGMTTTNGYQPLKPSFYFTPVDLKEFAV